MFSLIITIISIALVAALALATLYYGGAAFNQGRTEAAAARMVNEGQQIKAGMTLHKATIGTGAPDLQTLVDTEILKEIPQGWLSLDGYVAKPATDEDECLAANRKLGVDAIPTWAELQVNPEYAGKALCIAYEGT